MTEILCKTIMDRVLPAVRASVSINLSERGIKQTEISKRLGITQPAVSQYKYGQRGEMIGKVKHNKNMRLYIDKLADEISSNLLDFNTKTCEICAASINTGLIDGKGRDFIHLCETAKRK